MKIQYVVIRCIAGFKLWVGSEVFTFEHAQEVQNFLDKNYPNQIVDWNI